MKWPWTKEVKDNQRDDKAEIWAIKRGLSYKKGMVFLNGEWVGLHWAYIGSDEAFEENQRQVLIWAEENKLRSKVYPCGHVACLSSNGEPFPETCPWMNSHNEKGRAINP